MTDIFLSYSSKDREKVRTMHDALVAMGYAVFWDIETPAGENWDQWIRRNISEAKVVIVFWTKNSAASVNVQHECAIAREDNKLIPTQLEIMRAIDFPMGFYTSQAPAIHDWTGMVTHPGYASIIQAVRKRFEGTPEQVAEVARGEEAADIADLRRRANAGEASAQTELAYRYVKGKGVTQSDAEGVRLYKLAANQGSAIAHACLGWMHENGRCVPQDDAEAVRLYKLAANQGVARALNNLGWMHDNGRGVTQDKAEAQRLYNLAVVQGDTDAIDALKTRGKWPLTPPE